MKFKTTQSETADHKSPISVNTFKSLPTISFLVLFLLVIIIPNDAHAGIFSKVANLFSSEARAESLIIDDSNSQTTNVLEPKISPTGKTEKSENVILVNNNDVLVPEVGTLGTTLDVEEYPEADEISVYTIKKGDTLSSIAEMFNVSVNTIVWANDNIESKKSLKEGTTILIMPINGVNHTIKKGDTLNNIAKKYNADANDIAKFNGVTDETLVAGESIMIPNGEIAPIKVVVKPSSSSSSTKKSNTSSVLNVFAGNGKGTSPLLSGYGGASAGSYYRKPVRCIITQGLHGKNGIDIGCPIGTPIAAAAQGTVIAAKTGNNGGYGNMVIISHPNGTQTVYGHMSKINVSYGQNVSDGETIGTVGNTGQSTGPHLHFEVRGAKNCYADNSCR